MRRLAMRGPLFTLLAALAVGVGVFVVNDAVTGGSAGLSTAAAQAQQAPPAQDDPEQAPEQEAPAEGAAGDEYGVAAAPAEEAAPQADSTGGAGSQPEAGAEAPSEAAAGVAYAGRSAGNEVTIALGVGSGAQEGTILAYVCDGKKIESWLEGSVAGTSLRLTGPDGAEITADLAPDAVLGSVAVAGKSWPFSAQPEQIAGAATDRAGLRALGQA